MRFKKICRIGFLLSFLGIVVFIVLELWSVDVQPQALTKAQIAFYMGSLDGSFEIYVIDADGSNLRRLTNDPAEDWAPSWSPDGQWIAFNSGKNPNYDIYIMDANGKNIRKLVDNGKNATWSPDSRSLAFQSHRDRNSEIYVINTDGKNLRNLTNHPAADEMPAWSPDGRRIAFVSYRDGNDEIYVMDADGKNPLRLTNHPAMDDQPSWSPDSQKIAFRSYRDKNGEIYVMDADGKNLRNLTNQHLVDDHSPAWSPDGRWIAFVSDRVHRFGAIHLMDIEGNNITQPLLGGGSHPSWFDPNAVRPVDVSSRGKLKTIWGWLKNQ